MPASCSVFLNVSNLLKSVEWYESLGFEVTYLGKTKEDKLWWADLALEGAEISLGAISANDDPAYRAWVATPLGAGVVTYFTVPNVDKLWARAEKLGFEVEAPLQDRPYGRVFTLNDPDGYTVTFMTEPKKKTPAKRTAKAKKAPAKAKATAAKAKPARKAAKKPARGRR